MSLEPCPHLPTYPRSHLVPSPSHHFKVFFFSLSIHSFRSLFFYYSVSPLFSLPLPPPSLSLSPPLSLFLPLSLSFSLSLSLSLCLPFSHSLAFNTSLP